MVLNPYKRLELLHSKYCQNNLSFIISLDLHNINSIHHKSFENSINHSSSLALRTQKHTHTQNSCAHVHSHTHTYT